MYSLQTKCVSPWQNLHRCQGVKSHLSNYLSHCLHALENSERQTATRHLTCSLDHLGEGKGFSLCCILFDLNKNKNKIKNRPLPSSLFCQSFDPINFVSLGSNDDNSWALWNFQNEFSSVWLHGHAYSEWCSGSKRQQRKLSFFPLTTHRLNYVVAPSIDSSIFPCYFYSLCHVRERSKGGKSKFLRCPRGENSSICSRTRCHGCCVCLALLQPPVPLIISLGATLVRLSPEMGPFWGSDLSCYCVSGWQAPSFAPLDNLRNKNGRELCSCRHSE